MHQNAIKVLDLPTINDLDTLINHVRQHGRLPSDYVILRFRSETTTETLNRLEDERYCEMFL